jgi:hypothetical protein
VPQAVQPLAGKGVQGIADGGGGTAELECNLGRRFAAGAGRKDLAAAGGERVGRACELPQPLLLLGVERSDKRVVVSYHIIRAQLPLEKNSFALALGSPSYVRNFRARVIWSLTRWGCKWV